MKLCIISDTHGMHHDLRDRMPPADIVVHCGDWCSVGNKADARQFLRWFSLQPYPHKVLIAGNHDLCMEKDGRLMRAEMPAGITYLEDSGATVAGLKFWGSPVQPQFMDWAFNRPPGPDIKKHWDLIPTGVDVLVTHGPPKGVLDGPRVLNFLTREYENVGCADLCRAVLRVRPRLHCFGHIHCGYGQKKQGTIYVNAAICNEAYQPVNAPIVVEL